MAEGRRMTFDELADAMATAQSLALSAVIMTLHRVSGLPLAAVIADLGRHQSIAQDQLAAQHADEIVARVVRNLTMSHPDMPKN